MVASYTQLLGKRYGDRLEGDAQEFMAYIVDGAGRMKQLIEDLLAYSRVGTRGREFRPVKLDAVLERARVNLRAALEESGAELTPTRCPRSGRRAQLVQLLQNLIGNAIKFRGESTPASTFPLPKKDESSRIGARQRHRHRAAVLRAHFHGIPAPARQGPLPGHRHRPRDLQEGGGPARRPHPGGVGARQGQPLHIHATKEEGTQHV
jgi:nitrogen-specific signal transduction histidine kinase